MRKKERDREALAVEPPLVNLKFHVCKGETAEKDALVHLLSSLHILSLFTSEEAKE